MVGLKYRKEKEIILLYNNNSSFRMLYIAPIYSLFSPEHKYQEYDTFYTLFLLFLY